MDENTNTEVQPVTATVVPTVENSLFKEQVVRVLNEANKKINELFAAQAKNVAEQIKILHENQTKVIEQIQNDRGNYKARFEVLDQQNKLIADKLNEVIAKVVTPASSNQPPVIPEELLQ